MDNEVEKFPILRLTRESRNSVDENIAREFPVTIILNDQELVTLLCSPGYLDYLAVGFLSSEGFLKNKEQIKNILIDDERGVVRWKLSPRKNSLQMFYSRGLYPQGAVEAPLFTAQLMPQAGE